MRIPKQFKNIYITKDCNTRRSVKNFDLNIPEVTVLAAPLIIPSGLAPDTTVTTSLSSDAAMPVVSF